jgi:hypothetical protein
LRWTRSDRYSDGEVDAIALFERGRGAVFVLEWVRDASDFCPLSLYMCGGRGAKLAATLPRKWHLPAMEADFAGHFWRLPGERDFLACG